MTYRSTRLEAACAEPGALARAAAAAGLSPADCAGVARKELATLRDAGGARSERYRSLRGFFEALVSLGKA
jgi:hypothetical protein